MFDQPVLSPKQAFLDNMRPANLLLAVYRLLENEEVLTEGDLVTRIRALVAADDSEELFLIYNQVFVGLVREAAQIPRATLKKAALANLLRQAVVASATGLETYLPAVLKVHLPLVIRARGRKFFPDDEQLRRFADDLSFGLPDVLRLLGEVEEAPRFIADKVLGLTRFKYLGGNRGVHVVGSLLGIEEPWDQLAHRLDRDRKELEGNLKKLTSRRNDIVHRADRPQSEPTGQMQEIGFAWTKQTVETVNVVCLALDELIEQRMKEFREEIDFQADREEAILGPVE